MTKKETIKFIVQIIASVASAILTALGAHRAWACKEERMCRTTSSHCFKQRHHSINYQQRPSCHY
ncbi:smalltalk protein [Xylanibacter ruminicola]|uniref:smalltalk protein n=1 Tax=Xylanibacter ruminicola TaxID=839 RepID=UPI001114FD89|nr:smalltalk protein [Xylanibacter ruminicola]